MTSPSIREVKAIQQPSKACRDEWHYRARCPNPECRKWNQLDFMGYPESTCDHFVALVFPKVEFRVPKKEGGA